MNNPFRHFEQPLFGKKPEKPKKFEELKKLEAEKPKKEQPSEKTVEELIEETKREELEKKSPEKVIEAGPGETPKEPEKPKEKPGETLEKKQPEVPSKEVKPEELKPEEQPKEEPKVPEKKLKKEAPELKAQEKVEEKQKKKEKAQEKAEAAAKKFQKAEKETKKKEKKEKKEPWLIKEKFEKVLKFVPKEAKKIFISTGEELKDCMKTVDTQLKNSAQKKVEKTRKELGKKVPGTTEYYEAKKRYFEAKLDQIDDNKLLGKMEGYYNKMTNKIVEAVKDKKLTKEHYKKLKEITNQFKERINKKEITKTLLGALGETPPADIKEAAKQLSAAIEKEHKIRISEKDIIAYDKKLKRGERFKEVGIMGIKRTEGFAIWTGALYLEILKALLDPKSPYSIWRMTSNLMKIIMEQAGVFPGKKKEGETEEQRKEREKKFKEKLKKEFGEEFGEKLTEEFLKREK